MQIGHIGLFCNPKILLNSFMFWDFEASSPFLYCPVLSHSNCVSKYTKTKLRFVVLIPLYTDTKKRNRDNSVPFLNGGGGGIRTHGTRERTTVFKTAPINRSGTPPDKLNCNRINLNRNKIKSKVFVLYLF